MSPVVIEESWKSVLDYVKEKISENDYRVWIKPILPLSLNEQRLEIEVPNKFFEHWLRENYLVLIKGALLHALGAECDISFRLRRNPRPQSRTPRLSAPDKSLASGNLNFNRKYTFENFVVGSSNQFANAACLAVATVPGKNYNPLFIYGGVGLGKTHLLNAIGNHLIQNGIVSDLNKICYLSAEEFTNQLINSIRYEKMDEFR